MSEAGLGRVVLLEEPFAAFYAWLAHNEATWQAQMQDGQLILVCDIGGGTTDFTAIGVRLPVKVACALIAWPLANI